MPTLDSIGARPPIRQHLVAEAHLVGQPTSPLAPVRPLSPDADNRRLNSHDRLLLGRVAMTMASLMLSIGCFSFVAYSGHNHHILKLVAASFLTQAETELTPSDPNIAPAGSVPDERPITPAQVAAHITAADEPRLLKIKKLGITSRVIGLGQNNKGELLAPRSIFDAGWYSASAKPGAGGAVLIDGHSTGLTKQGVFSAIKTLVAGDEMSIERGDGRLVSYRVVLSRQFPADAVDMASAISPITPGKAGLNLITCAGIVNAKNFSFSDRIIVYAEQI